MEDRIAKLELQLAKLTGAAIVGSIAVFGFLGFSSWKSIPNEIQTQIEAKIGQETMNKINSALESADKVIAAAKLVNNSGQVAMKLVQNNKWSYKTSTNDWTTVGNMSTTVRVETDSLLMLIANGHTMTSDPDDWLYLSFFVEGEIVVSAPVHDDNGVEDYGPFLDYQSEIWETANFIQIREVKLDGTECCDGRTLYCC